MLDGQVTVFEVKKMWKGERSLNKITTKIITTCCLCGYEFEFGKTYLVYALKGSVNENLYVTSICSRTKYALEAIVDMEILNKIEE